MFNADDLLKLIKKSAVEAVNASKPANMVFGKVVSESPLKIQVEQKLILGTAQLVLSNNVTDYTVEMTIGGNTQECTVKNALKTGEKVILMQMSGGQKYIVVDRIGKDDVNDSKRK